MRVAVVHEWLVGIGGSELVTGEILGLWPHADLFSVVDFLSDEDRLVLGGKTATTTFVQRLPFARTRYQSYLPLMPLAIEQLDLSSYDLVISSSHAVAKGVITGPRQFHVSYVHSPMRYAWDLQHEYLRLAGLESGVRSAITRWLLHRLRIWDHRTAPGVDRFVANSRFVAGRVRKAYGRRADVVHPPVDIDRFTPCADKDDYFLTASRLVGYKRVGTIVEAFRALPQHRLVVVGDGPELESIRRVATPNVEVLGWQPGAALCRLMQRARAFVFCAEEDFGIAPVEAQACGTPVIAYGAGGALETVVPHGRAGATGLLFGAQSPEAVRDAVLRFDSLAPFSPDDCRRNAERFGRDRFRKAFRRLVEEGHAEHLGRRPDRGDPVVLRPADTFARS